VHIIQHISSRLALALYALAISLFFLFFLHIPPRFICTISRKSERVSEEHFLIFAIKILFFFLSEFLLRCQMHNLNCNMQQQSLFLMCEEKNILQRVKNSFFFFACDINCWQRFYSQ
jgi:hypothetical protein